MAQRDYTDLVTGLVIAAAGVGFSLYAATHYPLGTLARMGPGMFPTGLGVIFAAFGVMIVIPAFRRAGVSPDFQLRPTLVILASASLFAIVVPLFGLVPSVIALVLVSTFAETGNSILTRLSLAVALALIAVLIFTVGLKLPMATFRWPF